MTLRIEALGRHRLRAGADLLARALHDDPFAAWFLPNSTQRQAALRLIERAVLIDCLPFGDVHAAIDGGDLVGVTAWLPPGAHRPGFRRQLRQAPSVLRAAVRFPRRAADAVRVAEAERRIHPDGRHWWLVVVGVDPAHQGGGVGGALVEGLVSRAESEGLPAYLRTTNETNVGFYGRYGFSVREEVRPVPSAPPMWLLWREPKA